MADYVITLQAESNVDLDTDEIHDEFVDLFVDVGDYTVKVIAAEVRRV